MDAGILCQLLAQRINPARFQLWGLEIRWMSSEYDTPENNAIVAAVIENYETLVAEYLAGLEAAGMIESKIQAEIQRLTREQAIANLRENPKFETKLTLSNPIKDLKITGWKPKYIYEGE